jgi:hypothetical protein
MYFQRSGIEKNFENTFMKFVYFYDSFYLLFFVFRIHIPKSQYVLSLIST